MNCDLGFYIGSESISLFKGIDSELIPSEVNEDFLKLIKSSENWNIFLDALYDFMGNDPKTNSLFTSEYEYAISNCSAYDILRLFPLISFLGLDKQYLLNIKILLVDDFDRYGNVIAKKSATGEKIFLLDKNIKNIKKFERYLKLQKLINENGISKLADDSEELLTLKKILEETNKTIRKKEPLPDVESLVLHYLDNKSKYNNIYVDGKQAFLLLNEIIPEVEKVFTKRKTEYKDNKAYIVGNNIKFSKGQNFIFLDTLYKVLLNSLNFDFKGFKSQKDFKLKMSDKEKGEEVIKFFLKNFNITISNKTEGSGYELLILQIFKYEKGFPLIFEKISDDKLFFLSTYYQLKSTYGIGYDTIVDMRKIKYKGWTINISEEGICFISQHNLLEESYGKKYESIKEAKQAIDDKIDKQVFKYSFPLEIYLELNDLKISTEISLDENFEPIQRGTILKIKNIPLPNKLPTFEDPNEAIISSKSATINTFKLLILNRYSPEVQSLLFKDLNTLELIPEIENVHNAGLFLFLLNQEFGADRSKESISKVLDMLKLAPTLLFFVDSSRIVEYNNGKNTFSKKEKKVRLFKLPNVKYDDDYKKLNGYSYPMIAVWEATGKLLKNYFNIDLKIMTLNEIAEEYNELYSKLKAFIKGNQVIINSTLGSTSDLFHEYIHIIMGYMKNNKDLRPKYEALLQAVWNATSNRSKEYIKTNYGNLDFIDMLEENFASRFGEFISGKIGNARNENFTNLFSPLKEPIDTIFDKSELDLKSLGEMSITEIFKMFNTEISNAISQNENMFLDFASSDEFRLSAKKTNLLKRWIEEGKLKETNCK